MPRGQRLGLGHARRGALLVPPSTNLTAWYRADSYTLGSWPDGSGNGHTATQGTGSAKPTLNASDAAYGGQPTVAFLASSSQCLNTASWSLAQPDTVYVVGESTGANGLQQEFYDNINASLQHAIYIPSGGDWSAFDGSGLVSTNTTRGSAQAFCVVSNGASSAFYINSSAAAVASGAIGANTITGGICLGGFDSSSNFLSGKIAELLIYSGAHTAAQVSAVFKYLAARYGKTWS